MNQIVQSDALTGHRKSMSWLAPIHDNSFSFESSRGQKAAYVYGLTLLDKNTTQPNWGRIQQTTAEDYENRPADKDFHKVFILFNVACGHALQESVPQSSRPRNDLEVAQLAEKMRNWSQSDLMKIGQLLAQFQTEAIETPRQITVLERFDGFVDEIDGELALVTLKSESGETLIGEYPAQELLAEGIRERRRFICETVEVNDRVEVRLEALPDAPISDEEIVGLERRLDALVAGGDLDGDY